jgi:hypothetical protein
MTPTASGEFSCESCGKRYKLKPELAGKRVKCKCGTTMTVPAETPSEPDDLYDIVDTAPKPIPKQSGPVQAAIPIARPVAARAGGGGAIAYESKKKDRFAADNLIDLKRDIYFPTALFVVGMLGLLAWAVFAAHASSTGIVLFSALITVKTLIKTAILIGLALVVAPAAGLSFGTFWHAVLKFAAIIVFADAVLMWMEDWIDSLGGSSGRRTSIYIGLLKTMLLGAFIAIQLRFLFDMDSEETGMIAFPMAFVNRVLEFIIWIVLVSILEAALAPAAPAAPPVAAPNATVGAATPTLAAPGPSQEDQAIKAMIASAKEGHEWVAQFHTDKLHDVVYETISNAAPKRLYFKSVGMNAVAVLIELPESTEARTNVFAAANQMIARYSRDKTSLADTGQRYVRFEVPNNSKRK